MIFKPLINVMLKRFQPRTEKKNMEEAAKDKSNPPTPLSAWNSYKKYFSSAVKEIALQWLDYFLYKSITNVDWPGPEVTDLSQELVGYLTAELEPRLTPDDRTAVKNFVLRGRGCDIIRVLAKLCSSEWTLRNSHGFVELLINLSEFVLDEHCDGFSKTENEPRIEPIVNISFEDVLSLWREIESKYKKKVRRKRSISTTTASTTTSMSASAKNEAQHIRPRVRRRTPMKNKLRCSIFPESRPLKRKDLASLGVNLHSVERQFDQSSDSEAMEPNSTQARFIPRNPLDFDYFDEVILSEEEAQRSMDWRKSILSGTFNVSSKKSVSPPDFSREELSPMDELEFFDTILQILIKIMMKEAFTRNIKASYAIALTTSAFASENLTSSSVPKIRVLSLKLLLTALAELQFNIADNSPRFLSAFENASRVFRLDAAPNSAIQIQACLSRITNSVTKLTDHHYHNQRHHNYRRQHRHRHHHIHHHNHNNPGLKHRSQSDPLRLSKRITDACLRIQVEDIQRTFRLMASDTSVHVVTVIDFLAELKNAIIAVKGPCLTANEQAHILYKYLVSFAPTLMLEHSESVIRTLNLDPSSVLCVHPDVAWEYLLDDSTEKRRLSAIYKVIERIVFHYSWEHISMKDEVSKIEAIEEEESMTATSLSTVKSSTPVLSDSDSAFCASDNSLEMKGSLEFFGSRSSAIYVNLISKNISNDVAIMNLCDHIMRIMNSASPPIKKNIFVDVVLAILSKYSSPDRFHRILTPFCFHVIESCVNWEIRKFVINGRGNGAIIRSLSLQRVDFVALSLQYNVLSLITGLVNDEETIDVVFESAYFAFAAFIFAELAQTMKVSVTSDFMNESEEDSEESEKSSSSSSLVKDFYESLMKIIGKFLLLQRHVDLFRIKIALLAFSRLLSFSIIFREYCHGKGFLKALRELLSCALKTISVSRDGASLVVGTIGVILRVFIKMECVKNCDNKWILEESLDEVVVKIVESDLDEESMRVAIKEFYVVNFYVEDTYGDDCRVGDVDASAAKSLFDVIFNQEDFYENEIFFAENHGFSDDDDYYDTLKCEASDEDSDASYSDFTNKRGSSNQNNKSLFQNENRNKICENKNLVRQSFELIARVGHRYPIVAQYGLALWIRTSKNFKRVRSILNELNVGHLLLTEFKQKIADGECRELIDSIFGLLRVLTTEHRLDRSEYRAIIDFFKSETVPSAESLLDLMKMASLQKSNPFEPKHSVVLGPHKEFRFRCNLFETENPKIAFSFWVKCRDRSEVGRRFLSLKSGNRLFFEIQIIPSRNNVALIIRNDDETSASATFSAKRFNSMDWNNVIVNLSLLKTHAESAIFVNGSNESFGPLLMTFRQNRRSEKFSAARDHVLSFSSPSCSFEYSDLRIYKNFNFNRDEALAVFSKGHHHRDANLEFVLKQFTELHDNLPKFGTPECPSRTLDEIFNNNVLKRHFIHYCPMTPNRLLIYDRNDDESFFGSSPKIPSCLLPPNVIASSKDSSLEDFVRDNHESRFWNSVNEQGGMGGLLLLVARISEIGLPDHVLAMSLEIVFNVAHGSFEAQEDFDLLEGFLLITRIFNHRPLKTFTSMAIVNKSLNVPIVSYDNASRTIDWERLTISHPALLYPQLLGMFFVVPNLMNGVVEQDDLVNNTGCNTYFELFLAILNRLVKFANVNRNHNVRMLKEMDVISKLVYYLWEVSEESELKLNKKCVEDIGEILTAMIGSPPDTQVMGKIMRHALFLHDPAHTYVSHSKSSFYYNLKLGKTEPSIKSGESANAAPTKKFLMDQEDGQEEVNLNFIHETLNQEPSGATPSVYSSLEGADRVKLAGFSEFNCDKSLTVCPEHAVILDENPEPWGDYLNPYIEITANDEGEEEETDLSSLLLKILDVLSGVLLTMPDAVVGDVVKDVILPEYILVMANHPREDVRTKSVELMHRYVHRSKVVESSGYRVVQMDAMFLLGNQLHSYPATYEIVNACLRIVHDRPEFDLRNTWSTAKYIDICPPESLVPVLSLLPHVLSNTRLAHLLIVHLHDLLVEIPRMLTACVMNFGLLESLIKSLCNLTSDSDHCAYDQHSKDILACDLYNIFRFVVMVSVIPAGVQRFKIFEKLLERLRYALADYDHFLLRNAICIVFEEALVDIQCRISHIDAASYSSRRSGDSNHSSRGFNVSTSFHMDDISLETWSNKYFEKGQKMASRQELVVRFNKISSLACTYMTCRNEEKAAKITAMEENFFVSLVTYLLNELSQISERPKIRSITPKDHLKANAMNLLSFGLSPIPALNLRIRTLRCLELSKVRVTALKLSPDFVPLIKDLVENYTQFMEERDREFCFRFAGDIDVYPWIIDVDIVGVIEKIRRCYAEKTRCYDEAIEDQNCKIFRQLEELMNRVTSSATTTTETAMSAQDTERKAYINFIRGHLSDKVKVQQRWKSVLDQLTHERGVWVFESMCPRSWFLSEMEGAQRMRIRLERTNAVNIDERHYLPGRFPKVSNKEPPFKYLLQGPSGMSGVIIEKLNADDRITDMEQCTLVLPDDEFEGEILISSKAIYYVQETFTMTWYLNEIREIHLRRYQLKDVAVELFLTDGVTRFLVFETKEIRRDFLTSLADKQPRLAESSDPTTVMKMWQEGLITNFDYLMQLNKLAGRTFNDLMQYPVYPFVLRDYESHTLDLTNESSFRDLRKPISVQNPEKEEKFISTYNALTTEFQRQRDNGFPGIGLGPYHYGSHYSNTGIVLHFLLRLPPFTAMFLKYQDGNFDLPDRSFHSMADTWRLASNDSSTDVKELIPDLFCLPEMLLNNEGFDFGVRQSGERVNNVIVPPWAQNDPRLFIKIHRQALESRIVREHLSCWIDLVFGYKQSGAAAIEAINVFHPATYYGFDVDSIEDQVQRSARATMIKTYGQTPKQLFTKAHPMIRFDLTDEVDSSSSSSSPPSSTSTFSSSGSSASSAMKPVVIPRVIETVIGLRWGDYIGSPEEKEPIVVWRSSQSSLVKSLVPISNNEVYGIPGDSSIIVKCNRGSTRAVLRAGLISWNHPDSLIRLQIRKNSPGKALTTFLPDDVITAVAVGPENTTFWIGYESGKIRTIPHIYDHKELALVLKKEESLNLYAHSSAVTVIKICSEFGIVVTGSPDGVVVLWDMKHCSYIRTLNVEGRIDLIEVSRTCGDVGVVSQLPDFQSLLTLFTINGSLIGSRILEPTVTSLTFSTAPEGVSVNAVVTGHWSGIIRFWSSWDLTPIRDLPSNQHYSIIAIAFSLDNQHLYATTSNKEVIIFEKSNCKGFSQPPKYLNLSVL